jgi:pimeloyl-ACP methyl ester carboxylesterase
MSSAKRKASSRSRSGQRPTQSPDPRRSVPPSRSALPEVVDPRWILQAGAAVIAVGLLCAYLTLCGLFYFAQWQFVLHPSRTVAQTPAAEKLPFQPVRFADNLAGQPELSGWWIPSDSPADPTVLLLHGQNGSMSDALPAARALHDARLNVLVFDYRGYGQSAGRHPTEATMRRDSENALRYLTDGRHIPSSHILVYGADLGASLAVSLCAQHPAIAGLILSAADGDTETRVLADVRSRMIPVRLLFHERFPLADPLSRLKTPKLLISYTRGVPPVEAQRAADPKITAELPPHPDPALVTQTLRRFLGSYIARPPATL